MTYEDLKTWVQEPENKKKLAYAGFAVVMFFVGLGTGKFSGHKQPEVSQKVQTNYTTNAKEKPVTVTTEAEKNTKEVLGTTTPAVPTDCPVKGNIGSGGKKIYHVKGGAFYERTKAEQCFNAPAEAEAAGFVRSSR